MKARYSMENEKCCGECDDFLHEDMQGYGYCDVWGGKLMNCADKCIAKVELIQRSIKILSENGYQISKDGAIVECQK